MLQGRSLCKQASRITTIARRKADVVVDDQLSAFALVRAQLPINSSEKGKGMPVVNGIGKAGLMVFTAAALIGDFADAGAVEHMLENPAFSAAVADGQLPVIVRVPTRQRNGSFTVYQPGRVCGFCISEHVQRALVDGQCSSVKENPPRFWPGIGGGGDNHIAL
jgi:hypothetical protein